jgi:flagellar motor switch protein FliM
LGTGDSATVTWPAKVAGAAGADFTVSLGVSAAGAEGMLAIVAPLDMLRRGDEDESRAVWERLQKATVHVGAEVDGPGLTLGDLARLEPGDVVLLRGDTAQARIVVAGRTVATGQPGVSGGCLALRVGDIAWDRGEA